MVNFTIEQIQSIMKVPENIRNISIIAHVDHGKTTLSDSLVSRAGIIAENNSGNARYMSTSKVEQQRGITIKSSSISLHFEAPEKDNLPKGSKSPEFLINLIDSPGHVDFSSEVTAALRVTDGAIVVVDCVESVCVQTETVLRQAIGEGIKTVLFINKMDRFIRELQLSHEECYQSFNRVIQSVNSVIGNYTLSSNTTSTTDDMATATLMNQFVVRELSPIDGTVSFGSGYCGFGFNLGTFARIYSQKFGIPKEKLIKKLWGDNFYDAETKKWKTTSQTDDGRTLTRGFNMFCMDPIFRVYNSVEEGDFDALSKMMKSLGISLDEKDRALTGKDLFKQVMKKFLPVADTILEMVVMHLPSPVESQRYRVESLYEGPMDDECAVAIRNCDPNGPLMMYISKMIPTSEKGQFYAFGRVFSGTVRSSQKVRILNSTYDKETKKEGVYHKTIQRPVLMMGRKTENIDECPCGNIIGLVGVDQFIIKSATITTSQVGENIKTMKFTVSPVVKVAVQPKDPSNLPKLIEGLKRLAKADQSVLTQTTETGELIVAGVGELHLEICLNELATEYAGIEIISSTPVVSFRESISNRSSQISISKSPNNLNRLYCTAEPITMELQDAIENNKVATAFGHDSKALSNYLCDNFNWNAEDGKSIWTFGPESVGSNLLVNQTKGIQYMNEIKDSVVNGFQWSTKQGVLCEEEMRGVRFNLLDAKLHSDNIHRSGNQITPATRRVLYASQLTANPNLLEPIYLCEIVTPEDSLSGIYSVLSKRRGQVFGEERRIGTPLITIKSYLPVLESFGFSADLRANTHGKAFPQCTFSHWADLGNFKDNKKVQDLVYEIRKRKGLQPEIPLLSKFHDNI